MFENMKLQMDRVIDWFMPDWLRGDVQSEKRVRMFLISHLFGPFPRPSDHDLHVSAGPGALSAGHLILGAIDFDVLGFPVRRQISAGGL